MPADPELREREETKGKGATKTVEEAKKLSRSALGHSIGDGKAFGWRE